MPTEAADGLRRVPINEYSLHIRTQIDGSIGASGEEVELTVNPAELRQSWPRPSRPRPIAIIGAGGIVNDAHLPAYRKAGFPVAGIFDINPERARTVAAKWDVPVFRSLEEAMAADGVVFDLATPPGSHLGVLERLPEGSVALIQKPMGHDLDRGDRHPEARPGAQAHRGGQLPAPLLADDAGARRCHAVAACSAGSSMSRFISTC